MARGLVIGSTKNYDKIPESHRCDICKRGKLEVNFTVVKEVNFYRVRNKCNLCKGIKIVKRKTATIKEQIDLYFKEKSYD